MQIQETLVATATANGTQLYHEVRGEGSPILLIAGTPGDAGQFADVAAELAADHTVVTYDRRGNSRSAPFGGDRTSVAEQAEDAAALLEALNSRPALVYGSSNGAIIALELAIRRPGLVSGLMLHEPPLLSVLRDPAPIAHAIGEIVEPAFASGGPDAALEAFLRFAFGDATIDALPASERDRFLANGALAMTIEMPAMQEYVPARESLAALAMPVAVLVGEDQQVPLFLEAGAWLADALGTQMRRVPGAHGPQFDRPAVVASSIRDFARAAT